MKLIVGLGNPEPRYETTRHNAGFLALDLLAEKFGARWEAKKFEGEFGRGEVFGETCLFLKPQTYYNLSGKSVAGVARFFKLAAEDIIVICDDADVPAGKVKARTGGSAGGNNGIKSILAELGTDGFHRVKMGIGKPVAYDQEKGLSSWVLGMLTDDELRALQGPMFDELLIRLKGIFDQQKTRS